MQLSVPDAPTLPRYCKASAAIRSLRRTGRPVVEQPVARPVRTAFDAALLDRCSAITAARMPPSFVIQLHVETQGVCPSAYHRTVHRAVEELLCNALEHGFYARSKGRVLVGLATGDDGSVSVSVSDDGWGFGAVPLIAGNGFALLRLLGTLQLVRQSATGSFTAAAILHLPPY